MNCRFMSIKKHLRCTSCDYTTFISAGFDADKDVCTCTFTCLDCHTIEDYIVYEKELSEKRRPDTCHHCGGNRLETWDSVKNECPKCCAQLEIAPESIKLRWD